jgi:DNA-binding response OmpR family regulator
VAQDKPHDKTASPWDDQKLPQIARLAELGMSVAATAHDLRQPLSALKMALQMAREKIADRTEASADLDDALRQLERVEILVERTRNLFAPPQGMHPIDLVELVGEIAAAAKWQPGLSGRARLEASVDEDVPRIMGDRPLLEQLVVNLINNARDAVEQGGDGRVLIAVRSAQGGGGADLIVADDGVGIPPEIAARMFEPFVTTKAEGKGTGLGLYIAKRAAEDHGATIGVMAPDELAALDLGRFTTGFRIAFPNGAVRDSQRIPLSRRPSTAPPSGRRALVVEDEPTARRLVGKILEAEGFECTLCGTGEEAIAALERAPFDLLVADKNLPGVSGVEVARLVRRRCARARVLIATGYPSDESAFEAMEMGVHGYLIKPLDVDALREHVRSLFGASYGVGAPRAETGETAAPPMARPRDLKILIAEPDHAVRRAIQAALDAAGCGVEALAHGGGVRAAMTGGSVRVLIARPEVLARERDWLSERGDGVSGALAIMDRAGVDRSIEAIHCGARGMIVPPFEAAAVVAAIERVVAQLEQERGGRS